MFFVLFLQTTENCTGELRKLSRRSKYSNLTLSPDEIWPHAYDSTWALALVLNQTVEELKTKVFRDGSMRRLEDFTYEDEEMALLFYERSENDCFSRPNCKP